MTIPNRITLEQAATMKVAELVALPTDQIALLLEDVSALKLKAKVYDAILFGALDTRFREEATKLRRALQKDTGVVRITADEMVVVADLPKEVEWNQAGLRKLIEEIKGWEGGDPAEYISTELKVSETKFTAWPTAIKKLFEPHRTVKPKKATYKIEKATA